MSLLHAILSHTRLNTSKSDGKLYSPPPEINPLFITKKIKKKRVHKYAHVTARVDTSPPFLSATPKLHGLVVWAHKRYDLCRDNMNLLMCIRATHFKRGRVDSHWGIKLPPSSTQYYQTRVDFMKRIQAENKIFYHQLKKAQSSLPTTAQLNRDWKVNRKKIVRQALCNFVLFDPVPKDQCEEPAFLPPPSVKRPRIYIKLGMRGGASIGELCIELFTDVCPNTCRLFMELLDEETVGYGYIGTCFFRKVPYLYWSGGDVIYNNGFGCYMQRNRRRPIGAENYHFSHSMPGLLSMRVTVDNEMCGIFSITFKPLPQFDLKGVVFGRIIRPCNTYNVIEALGNPLSTYPVIEVWSARRKGSISQPTKSTTTELLPGPRRVEK